MDLRDESGASKATKEVDAVTTKPTYVTYTDGAMTEIPADTDLTPLANKDIIFTLKLEGRLGIFYERAQTSPVPTPVQVDIRVIHCCAVLTLSEVITRALNNPEYEPFDVGQLAETLANGIVVMTNCKLRSVNCFHIATMNRYLTKPVVPQPFEVPEPYALAISQLGSIKVRGMRKESYFLPTISADHTTGFDLPGAYCKAVEQAKKIGLHFASVDLSVKMGSSWWLYQPHQDGDLFCLIPEENFTVQTAMLRNLFSVNADGGYQSDIVDLTPLGNTCYGVMCRNPPEREDVAIYCAVIKDPL